jgi:hypothetical protein
MLARCEQIKRTPRHHTDHDASDLITGAINVLIFRVQIIDGLTTFIQAYKYLQAHDATLQSELADRNEDHGLESENITFKDKAARLENEKIEFQHAVAELDRSAEVLHHNMMKEKN